MQNDVPVTKAEAAKAWLARWLQPNKPRAVVLCFIIMVLIGLVSLLVYETGGTRYAWLHLMYVPIILAAACFGIYGGVAAALAGGLAIGPFMPENSVVDLSQTSSNWIFRIGFFLLVGVLSGFISNFLNGQIRRLKLTNLRLIRAHEDLKNTQMQLIQTAKLESIGRLAAGIAHEVKNPLAVIQLGVDFLGNTMKEGAEPDSAEVVREIKDAVQRADIVIKGLLNFSRSEKLALVPVDLNPLIEESLVLVKHEFIKNHIELGKKLGADLPKVGLDQNKIKQVLINMFVNAIQAMSANGNLSVKTFIQPPPGNHVVVLIEDTGSGIPQDKIDRLFEPFFTTKPVGSGTGLGLSVSKNIIEMHGGTINIANRTDARGAAVTIMFPIPNKGSL